MEDDSNLSVRLLCRPKLPITGSDPGIQWLIGSPFFPPLTVASILRCIHTLPSPNSSSPDLPKESEELRALILKGFEVIGALASGDETNARAAVDAARGLRILLYGEGKAENQAVIGAVAGSDSGELRFFVSKSGNATTLESVTSIVQEEHPEKFVWENGWLLRCELPIKLPLYYPLKNPSDVEKAYVRATDAVVAKLRDPQVVYILEALNKNSLDLPPPAIIRGGQLDFHTDLSKIRPLADGDDGFDSSSLTCSYFSINSRAGSTVFSVEILSKLVFSLIA